jgi:hypothetical protein
MCSGAIAIFGNDSNGNKKLVCGYGSHTELAANNSIEIFDTAEAYMTCPGADIDGDGPEINAWVSKYWNNIAGVVEYLETYGYDPCFIDVLDIKSQELINALNGLCDADVLKKIVIDLIKAKKVNSEWNYTGVNLCVEDANFSFKDGTGFLVSDSKDLSLVMEPLDGTPDKICLNTLRFNYTIEADIMTITRK